MFPDKGKYYVFPFLDRDGRRFGFDPASPPPISLFSRYTSLSTVHLSVCLTACRAQRGAEHLTGEPSCGRSIYETYRDLRLVQVASIPVSATLSCNQPEPQGGALRCLFRHCAYWEIVG